MEYSDTKWRAAFGILTEVAFALFYMLLPLYAYLMRDWRHLQLAFALSTLPLLLYYFLLPESSRWLAQHGRGEEALDILQSIAVRNRMPAPPSRGELKRTLDESCHPPEGYGTPGGVRHFLFSYAALVATPELRRRSFALWFLFAGGAFCYYGVSLGSPSLSSDPFLIVFIGGLVEIPGYLGTIPLASKWGRKPTMMLTLLVTGVMYSAVAFVPLELSGLRVTMAMVAKLFVSAGTSFLFLAAELYPTKNRTTGLGLSVLFGRFGSIAAPYVVRAKFGYEGASIVIVGLVAMVAALIALFLPETKDEEMFEKVAAIEGLAVARRLSSAAEGGTHALNALQNSNSKEGEVGRN